MWRDCVYPAPRAVARLTAGVLAAAAALAAGVAAFDAVGEAWTRWPLVVWEARRRAAEAWGRAAGGEAPPGGAGADPGPGDASAEAAPAAAEPVAAPPPVRRRRPAPPAFGVRRARGWPAFEALG